MLIVEKEFNAETGKETIIEREENAVEKAEREAFEARVTQSQINQAIIDAAKEAAQAKLAALGLTADDLKALGL
jgi:3-dehydroquinate dehydratase